MKIKPGTVGSEGQGTRDAFHVPAVMVSCWQDLIPGDDVRFMTPDSVERCVTTDRQGIVDPFIKEIIPRGSVFWMFLEPGTVQDLIHDFEIPGVARPIDVEINRLQKADLEKENEDDSWCRTC